MARVINTDGKGPRVYCAPCGAWVAAAQRPWPKSGYVAARHSHAATDGSE